MTEQPFELCTRCGQLSDDPAVCAGCRELERAEQGTAVRLFTPAPAHIPGQTFMELPGPE